MLDEAADPSRIRRTTTRLVRNLLIFAGLAILTLVFSMQIDILAYFWIYLLVEFVAFAIRRTQRFFQHRKLPKAEKSNMASYQKVDSYLKAKRTRGRSYSGLLQGIVDVISEKFLA